MWDRVTFWLYTSTWIVHLSTKNITYTCETLWFLKCFRHIWHRLVSIFDVFKQKFLMFLICFYRWVTCGNRIYIFIKILGYRRLFFLILNLNLSPIESELKMTEPIDDANNTKLIALKKFFIFNSKYGSIEGEVRKKKNFFDDEFAHCKYYYC